MPPASRVGDYALVPADGHGCPACPHTCVGPGIQGSCDVLINGLSTLRIQDPGIHAACCGPNQWKCAQGSPTVLVNNKNVVRQGDATAHCGGGGQMIQGSCNVLIGDAYCGSYSPRPEIPTDLLKKLLKGKPSMPSKPSMPGLPSKPSIPKPSKPSIPKPSKPSKPSGPGLPEGGFPGGGFPGGGGKPPGPELPEKPSIPTPEPPEKPHFEPPEKPEKPSFELPGPPEKPEKPSFEPPEKPDKPSMELPEKPDEGKESKWHFDAAATLGAKAFAKERGFKDLKDDPFPGSVNVGVGVKYDLIEPKSWHEVPGSSKDNFLNFGSREATLGAGYDFDPLKGTHEVSLLKLEGKVAGMEGQVKGKFAGGLVGAQANVEAFSAQGEFTPLSAGWGKEGFSAKAAAGVEANLVKGSVQGEVNLTPKTIYDNTLGKSVGFVEGFFREPQLNKLPDAWDHGLSLGARAEGGVGAAAGAEASLREGKITVGAKLGAGLFAGLNFSIGVK